ncbi:glycoside hydrolase family 2 TIM barrel-domain containing protein [Paraflavisolibacter sp. H34]|uniref:glycoside hydrolase family 2 TIM barrel-domain containing protein n=1 Tax=Huijunlia imazamoxiresistens TaxID=3127457 RepID=UPI0030160F63
MKAKFSLFTSLLFSTLIHAQTTASRYTLFDNDWRFFRGGATGAEHIAFPDSSWRQVNLPHDWSIEDIPGTASPFSIGAISQVNGGFTVGGTGWYRKTFTVPAAQKGKRLFLQFDGIYMNADVYLNGKKLGSHPYGYTSFWFDITDRLKWNEKNVVSVRIRNEGENSRWYSGSGIYRHVWLASAEPVHVAPWGTSITTPDVTAAAARVTARTKVTNTKGGKVPVTLVTRLLNNKGIEAARFESKQTLDSGATYEFSQDLQVKAPQLWSPETPVLYTAVSEVLVAGQPADRLETPFGIRSISFDATNGFRLNGKTVKLKGGCVHHDNGPLGAKAYDRAEERRVELLKAAGYNAIRSSHNPPSPAFLDACDRLGMLVIDEAFDSWKGAKNPQDYHLYFEDWWQRDVESMIFRDRNHPSVIMWSTGNEIPNRDKPEVVAVSKMLTDYVHKLDPTRPVTCGVNGVGPDKDPFFATLDVGGYNYAPQMYKVDHERVPNRVVYGSESFPKKALEYWKGVEENSWVIGDFVWTAFDYIGEASIGWLGYPQRQYFFPWNLAYCGDIDICGWKRPQSFYRDAIWKPNQLSLFVKPLKPSFDTLSFKEPWSEWEFPDLVSSWNWKPLAGQGTASGSAAATAFNVLPAVPVVVYSSCEQVELFLNGKSLGKKATNRSNEYIAEWQVPFREGQLKAVGYNGKKQVNVAELKTAGAPAALKLTADRSTIKADGQDLSYVTVELVDDKGVRHPTAENLVQFEVEGGTIVGVGNANPRSTESFQLPQRKAWQGRALVIVQSKPNAGPIVLKAKAEGLKDASLAIAAK